MFRGGLPQLTDTTVVVEPGSRHLLTTVTTGTVLVRHPRPHPHEHARPPAHASPTLVAPTQSRCLVPRASCPGCGCALSAIAPWTLQVELQVMVKGFEAAGVEFPTAAAPAAVAAAAAAGEATAASATGGAVAASAAGAAVPTGRARA